MPEWWAIVYDQKYKNINPKSNFRFKFPVWPASKNQLSVWADITKMCITKFPVYFSCGKSFWMSNMQIKGSLVIEQFIRREVPQEERSHKFQTRSHKSQTSPNKSQTRSHRSQTRFHKSQTSSHNLRIKSPPLIKLTTMLMPLMTLMPVLISGVSLARNN